MNRNWDNWNIEVVKLSQDPNLRKGQIYMNALGIIDINLYEKLTGTEFDCFYEDKKCEDFLEKLMEEWV